MIDTYRKGVDPQRKVVRVSFRTVLEDAEAPVECCDPLDQPIKRAPEAMTSANAEVASAPVLKAKV